jgi:hypothetical protein
MEIKPMVLTAPPIPHMETPRTAMTVVACQLTGTNPTGLMVPPIRHMETKRMDLRGLIPPMAITPTGQTSS